VARSAEIPYYIISKDDLYQSNHVTELLKECRIDLIVLAGFIWMIPANILFAFPERIINLHPALLPKFGGQGMYGRRVFEEVIKSGEKETGITVHHLNEKFDDGEIIFQKSVPVEAGDTASSIEQKVHELEYEWYPKIIEQLVSA